MKHLLMNNRLYKGAYPRLTKSFIPVNTGFLQRQCACGQHTVAGGECAECRKKQLQRKAASHTGSEIVPPIVHEVLRSSGQPLDPTTRAYMEPRFGQDFSRVQVHTDAKAAESARAVDALAYTVGRDVVFGAGQYDPASQAGKRLLAHELTHVVQQTAAGMLGLQRAEVEDEEKKKVAVAAPPKALAEAAPVTSAGAGSTPAAPVGVGSTPTALAAAAEATDGAIDALNLAATAKSAAKGLKKKHPDITFTSGRRNVSEQASAMASNIVSSKDRKWIEKTYVSAAALQKWVDDNPQATSQKDIATGLEKTMNNMTEADQGKISKHLSGEAFDVQPQEKDAAIIKKDIQVLPGLSKFLEKEGGLVRWHAQFKKVGNMLAENNGLEQAADRMAEWVVHSQVASTALLSEPQTAPVLQRRPNEQAAGAARAVNALAYTVGRDVVFGTGHLAEREAQTAADTIMNGQFFIPTLRQTIQLVRQEDGGVPQAPPTLPSAPITTPALVIDQPTASTRFNIDATPTMPTINCRARITGPTPDPTPNTDFNWQIQITEAVTPGGCASSRIGNCSSPAVSQNNVRGGNWTPIFSTVQGGQATITAAANLGGTPLSTSVTIDIRGTNPGAASITALCGGAGTDADRVACHESGRKQFDGNGNPLLGPGGDVGVVQLCNPPATCLQRWDWTSNVNAGIALLGQKRNGATAYLNTHVVAGNYPNNLNLSNADVIQRESLQRYNGGRYWRWNPTANRWERNSPNNYVANLLAHC